MSPRRTMRRPWGRCRPSSSPATIACAPFATAKPIAVHGDTPVIRYTAPHDATTVRRHGRAVCDTTAAVRPESPQNIASPLNPARTSATTREMRKWATTKRSNHCSGCCGRGQQSSCLGIVGSARGSWTILPLHEIQPSPTLSEQLVWCRRTFKPFQPTMPGISVSGVGSQVRVSLTQSQRS